jgi:hypothetical protein
VSQSLLLDTVTWDLCLDAKSNIAVASEPYSLAQDAACAVRLFFEELWYDTTQGVDYWQNILAQGPPLALVKAQLASAAAASNPDIASAVIFFSGFTNRGLTGQVQITSTSGQTAAAAF